MTSTDTMTRLETVTVPVPARELKRALDAVLPHAGTDDDLPSLQCVSFDASGGWLFLATTDRYSMAVARCKLPDRTAELAQVLLPGDAAAMLRRILKGSPRDAAVSLAFGDGEIRASAGDVSACWKAVDAKFPEWRPMIGKFLASETAHFGPNGVSASLLARLTDASAPGEVLGMRVTLGSSRTIAGKTRPSPVLLATRGEWFIAALMPARLADDDQDATPALAGWAALAAPAEAVSASA
jgi:hypothetical protein